MRLEGGGAFVASLFFEELFAVINGMSSMSQAIASLLLLSLIDMMSPSSLLPTFLLLLLFLLFLPLRMSALGLSSRFCLCLCLNFLFALPEGSDGVNKSYPSSSTFPT